MARTGRGARHGDQEPRRGKLPPRRGRDRRLRRAAWPRCSTRSTWPGPAIHSSSRSGPGGSGLPRHGGRRHRRVGTERGPLALFFDGAQQRQESARLVRRAFGTRRAASRMMSPWPSRPPRATRAGCWPSSRADGDVLVLGTEHDQAMKRLVHGSVSHYCRSTHGARWWSSRRRAPLDRPRETVAA